MAGTVIFNLIFVIVDLILPFSPKKPARQLSRREPVLMLGSCFAEEIGNKLAERRFSVVTNPHGILYNPLSLSRALTDYLAPKKYTESDLFHFNGLWQSFTHHGRFSHMNAGDCLEQINREIDRAHEQLKKCRWLLVTFGSAYVYWYKKTAQFVGNCHKLPSAEFEKRLLTQDDIVSAWQLRLEELKKFNPGLQLMFTVSPVRYVRDGLVENNRSKAILLNSVHHLVEAHENCHYFPAYEIVIDQLRDYRFYKEDLVHPNHLAVNFVWEKFVSACCDETTRKFLEEYEPLLRGLQHRPIHHNKEAHEKFRLELAEKIKALDEKYL